MTQLAISLRNTLVDAWGSVSYEVSLHDGDPGSDGSNEIGGVSRQSVSFADASEGFAEADSDIVFNDVPGDGTEVTHVSLWDDTGDFLSGGETTSEEFSNPGSYTLTELTIAINNPS